MFASFAYLELQPNLPIFHNIHLHQTLECLYYRDTILTQPF